LGDLERGATVDDIQHAVSKLLSDGFAPVVLGGDHAISFPVIAALHKSRRSPLTAVGSDVAPPTPPLAVLHFDAHTDTYDSLLGNRYSHACPFARVAELQPPPRIVQVGVRTFTPFHREQARRFGIGCLEARHFPETRAELRDALRRLLLPPGQAGEADDEDRRTAAGGGSSDVDSCALDVYVSVDMDALDPSFAPGVSHHEPGGLSTRQLLSVLHCLPELGVRVVGGDCVEYNPTRDVNGVTAMVAAKITKELIGLVTLGEDADGA